jgi:hypothetical protein
VPDNRTRLVIIAQPGAGGPLPPCDASSLSPKAAHHDAIFRDLPRRPAAAAVRPPREAAVQNHDALRAVMCKSTRGTSPSGRSWSIQAWWLIKCAITPKGNHRARINHSKVRYPGSAAAGEEEGINGTCEAIGSAPATPAANRTAGPQSRVIRPLDC